MIITNEHPPLRDFEMWAGLLRKIYYAARRRREVRPRDNAVNALKDALYTYYRVLKDAELLGELERYVVETHDPWKGPMPGPPTWVVRLIETGTEWLLDDSARNRMVADLMLADLNDVHPDMLLAFIYEAGPVAVRKDALANQAIFDWAAPYRAENR